LSHQDPVSYLMRALAIGEKVLGSEHPDTMTFRENYTDLLERMKRKAEAAGHET
jgi:hypothetical protein